MALLGMGTNTQCNGYFPAYYSTMDQNMYANSSTRPLNNIGKRLEHADHYYGFSLHSSPDQVLGYDTQALKQTILKHETMFRDQVSSISSSNGIAPLFFMDHDCIPSPFCTHVLHGSKEFQIVVLNM